MKYGFIFAGQGQQFYCMGQDLVTEYPLAEDIYNRAKKVLGYNILELSEEQLQQTLYTQPALYTLGHVLDCLLKENGVIPSIVSGLSLGEYNALTSAGVLSFEAGLKLISQRAKIMQEAFEPNTTGMAACIKTDKTTVSQAIANTNIEICNINTLSQIVIGGKKTELDEVVKKLKEKRIMAIPLKVSTVSHMSLMREASDKLGKILRKVKFNEPKIDFINNLHGDYQTSLFDNTLARHISEPTELATAILKMQHDGITNFIEVGPKGSISKFVKELCGNDIVINNVYDLETLKGVINE